jgi:alpha-methylacyl-CoA racemase
MDDGVTAAPGPLDGIRVIDLSQNAPGPFATMMLGDLGADVVHVANPRFSTGAPDYLDVVLADPLFEVADRPLMRNKRSIALDLKDPEDHAVLLDLVRGADVFVEEMRPGKADRLGVGYEYLSTLNPRLVYCSVSAFGQTGPLRNAASHDLNIQALCGFVSLVRDRDGTPVPPQNLLGDYAGGGLMAVVGILAALAARARTGLGQHVDAAMSDGALYLMTDLLAASLALGQPSARWRGTLGGELPVYSCYRCADGGWLAVAALEKRFAASFLATIGRPELMDAVEDRSRWAEARGRIAEAIASAPRAVWLDRFAGTDACVSPVVDAEDLEADPQVRAREMIVTVDGRRQVGVAPKFSATPGSIRRLTVSPDSDRTSILAEISRLPKA